MSGRQRHIAVIAPPLAGHYDPLRVLALALAARGHRLTFFHIAEAAARVPEPELGFVAVGNAGAGSLARYVAGLGRSSGAIGRIAMIRTTAAMTGLLLDALPGALARAGVDAAIADATEPAGALAARHLGLPFVTSVTGLPLLRERAVPPPFTGWSYRTGRWGLARNATGYGIVDALMRPITRTVRGGERAWGLDHQADGGVSPLLQLAQCPAAFDFPRRQLPPGFRYGAPLRPATVPPLDLPEDGRPLVYCSLGSLQGGRAALFAAMTRACADLGARAIVAHGGQLSPAAARALPGDPLVAAFWPQPAVLPRCAAAIVHGGFNTVLDALAAGVPMVALPLAFEQPGTAARIAHHGAGLVLHPRRRTVAGIRAALDAVLADGRYRLAAARLGATMAPPDGGTRAAAMVEAALEVCLKTRGKDEF